MLKNFLNGFLFGAGFTVAALIVLFISFKFIKNSTNPTHKKEEIIISNLPNTLETNNKFLGSTAHYSGEFLNKKSILSAGRGEIRGLVTSNGHPTKGLKLRLALNGKAMSQWAITNDLGEYVISVPYGKYKIYGHELDLDSANTVLSGLINNPMHIGTSDTFNVSEEHSGIGINFAFVSPVTKISNQASYRLKDPIIIAWQPYAGAVNYKIQVYEKSNPYEHIGNDVIFSWSRLPQTDKTTIDLNSITKNLKPDHYYSYQVTAMDTKHQQISESIINQQSYDFAIK